MEWPTAIVEKAELQAQTTSFQAIYVYKLFMFTSYS
jgi:hypothetical protein